MFKTKIRYVKVLIQEFEGKELVEPNKHYSKCIMLYETTPKKVYDELLPFLTGNTKVKHKRAKRKAYKLSTVGRRNKFVKMQKYWATRRKERMGGA